MSRHRFTRRGFTALELTGVVMVIAVIAAGLLYWGGRALDQSRQVDCRSNLKQIALALNLYAQDNGNRLPPDADAALFLTQHYMKNSQILQCAEDRSPVKVTPPTWLKAANVDTTAGLPDSLETSYFMVPGLANDDPPASVVAGDTQPRHRGRWNAACLDGRVITLPAGELAQYLRPGGKRP